MFLRRNLLPTAALGLALAGCSVPAVGTAPVEQPQPATAAAAAPMAPTPASPAPVAAPTVAPPPLSPGPARQRLTGHVLYNGQAMEGAALSAFDLASGKALALGAWSGAGSGGTGTQRTDAQGAFDVGLPPLAGGQLVKLVARSGSQTFVTVFDARGRAVSPSDGAAEAYRLAQARTVAAPFRLSLTPATTGSAKAFEGALKLTFQLPEQAREAEQAAALSAAAAAARVLEAALARRPEVAAELVAGFGPDGELLDLDAFRLAISRLGAFDAVFAGVQGRLVAVAAQRPGTEAAGGVISAEDFPLDRVTISSGGALSFSGGQLVLGGGASSGFVPTPARSRSRAGGPVPLPPYDTPFTGIRALSHLGDRRFWLINVIPDVSRDRVQFTRFEGGQAAPSLVFEPESLFSLRSWARLRDPSATATLVTTLSTGGNCAVTAVDPVAGTVRILSEFAAVGRQDAPCVAAGWTHFFLAQPKGNPRKIVLYDRDVEPSGTFQLASGPWDPGPNLMAMAVHDQGDASPTVVLVQDIVGTAVVVAGQQGGAARELATLPGVDITSAVIATPTLYLASRTPGAEVVYSVNVDTLATGVFVSKAGEGGLHASGRTPLAYGDAPYGLALDEGDASPGLYFAAPPSGGGALPQQLWRVALP